MVRKQLTIINKLGLHARAAAKLVSLASSFGCDIKVEKDGREVNAKSIMGVMMLAASQNSAINVTINGENETEALEKIEQLINNRFGENE